MGLGGLVEANAVLQQMAVNDYSKAVEGHYVGIFADVAGAVNGTQTRIVHLTSTVKKVAQGDLTDLAEYKRVGRRSEHDELVPSLVQLMENLGALVADAGMLAKAAVEGKLATRADATKHGGDYRKVIEGFNLALDNVIKPLNVSAEYVDRISKGDIPPKITDTYQGDFNEIKNNLNACIDGLGGLVEANAVLQRMTVNDYSKAVEGHYVGIFADVAGAVNGTQTRIVHLTSTVKKVAQGDLTDLAELQACRPSVGTRRIGPIADPVDGEPRSARGRDGGTGKRRRGRQTGRPRRCIQAPGAIIAKLSKASTRCWTPYCCPSGKATGS